MHVVPVGFRFRPTDEELVDHYLNLKLNGHHSLVQIIPDLDMCKLDPWDIPALSVIKSEDPEWYFFNPRDYKYSNNSSRTNRTTKSGFWKATGRDRNITKGNNVVIGAKKTLVFHRGRPHNCFSTHWVIHEYHATTFPLTHRDFVLCRLMKKSGKKAEEEDAPTYDGGESSNQVTSYNENQASSDRMPNVYTWSEVNLESMLQPPPQMVEEYQLPWVQQSLVVDMEQEPSISNSAFSNVHFGSENNNFLFPGGTAEEEEENEFLNSILAD